MSTCGGPRATACRVRRARGVAAALVLLLVLHQSRGPAVPGSLCPRTAPRRAWTARCSPGGEAPLAVCRHGRRLRGEIWSRRELQQPSFPPDRPLPCAGHLGRVATHDHHGPPPLAPVPPH